MNIKTMFRLVAIKTKSTVPERIKLIVTVQMRTYRGHLTV